MKPDLDSSMSRRAFLRGAAGTMAFLSLPAFARPASRDGLTFTFGARKFPMLLPQETITASAPIRHVEFFKPLFGMFRDRVNPVEPVVRGRTLQFTRPGEYYLRLNKTSDLKVLVFAPDEGIPASMLRMFDFAVANSLYLSAHDKLWYSGREQYLLRFFNSDEPFMLSCGPTHQFFRRLVDDRFCLPTRIVTAYGVFYHRDRITSLAHNVPEVYIPELDQYVFFDINSGYVPLWHDALSLSAMTRRFPPRAGKDDSPAQIGLNVHAPIEICPAAPSASKIVQEQDQWGAIDYSGELVSGETITQFHLGRFLRAFYIGAAYWGKNTTYVRPTGTEFLDGWLQYGVYETDPALLAAAKEGLDKYFPETLFVEPDVLRGRLADGHLQTVTEHTWTERFPAATVTL
jgi:hypothetical protein